MAASVLTAAVMALGLIGSLFAALRAERQHVDIDVAELDAALQRWLRPAAVIP